MSLPPREENEALKDEVARLQAEVADKAFTIRKIRRQVDDMIAVNDEQLKENQTLADRVAELESQLAGRAT